MMLPEREVLALHRAITAIHSVSGEEGELADFLEQWWRRRGVVPLRLGNSRRSRRRWRRRCRCCCSTPTLTPCRRPRVGPATPGTRGPPAARSTVSAPTTPRRRWPG